MRTGKSLTASSNTTVNDMTMKAELKSKLSDMMTTIETHLNQIHRKVKRSAKETIQFVEQDMESNFGAVSFETTSNEAQQESAFNSQVFVGGK